MNALILKGNHPWRWYLAWHAAQMGFQVWVQQLENSALPSIWPLEQELFEQQGQVLSEWPFEWVEQFQQGVFGEHFRERRGQVLDYPRMIADLEQLARQVGVQIGQGPEGALELNLNGQASVLADWQMLQGRLEPLAGLTGLNHYILDEVSELYLMPLNTGASAFCLIAPARLVPRRALQDLLHLFSPKAHLPKELPQVRALPVLPPLISAVDGLQLNLPNLPLPWQGAWHAGVYLISHYLLELLPELSCSERSSERLITLYGERLREDICESIQKCFRVNPGYFAPISL